MALTWVLVLLVRLLFIWPSRRLCTLLGSATVV